MSSSRSLTPLDASQYDAIEDAVRETERGRWFLTEYARRNRNADTEVLLDAIRRIENVVTTDRPDDVGRFRGDLMEMADAIARTRAEVAALSTAEQGESRLTVASEALDAIVRATERATSDILSAAEEVQEAAWTLRETGIDSELCDALDRHATQIYTACSFQDLTAQRTSRVVHTLRYLENRIASMIGIWGSPEDAVPPLGEDAPVPAAALDQSDVDRFLDMEGPAPAPTVSTLRPLPTMVLDDDLAFLPASPETPEPAHEEEPAEPITTEMAAPVAVLSDEIPTDLFAMEMPEIEAAAEPETVSAVLVPAPAEPELAEAFGAEDKAAFEVVADVEAVDVVEEAEPAAELTIPAAPEAVMPLAEPLIVAAVEPMAADDLAAAFPDLDTLSIEEKIALFA
ncbi:hypothetical protein [Methylorubrum extorquens]|uniref:Chemotaxis protein CheZ n=1 Tax=Methylorubrum extorquens (strain CM4 / NCIMB 13688) TaxID=440085 RepID=B7L0P4_METC4|nr:hypothetical protein [Methylorubrum extorquens]ABY29294.1 hypothetical protein Mext_0889 [Methylorubrum extorquens PA1]ACK81767.1 conserved hypothetical protein [Methylorubrum extorquens CM4]KQP89501.1 hypothetical protein ASF55_23860 [Methylobacterium sp. Leaf119]WIU40630.1 hypothetical protein KQ926_04675 [Methylorubrum extorquens]